MSELREKTVSGLVYKLFERAGAKGIGFIISIILARILLPEDYGTVALVTIFIAICDVFVTSGFASALVVNKNSDNDDFSTCLYFNIVFSIAIYILIYFTAPLLADYYNNRLLIPTIRVMALRIPIASINSIEQAYVQKSLQFKLFFYSTLVGTIVSGVISIVMAYAGYGVWALIEQNLGNMIIDTIVLWITIKWRPKRVFSLKRFKSQFSFGWKMLASGLIDTLYAELRGLFIGKLYTSADLAYYNKGFQFSQLGISIVEPTISGVLFPAFAKCNENKELMKAATRRSLRLSSYIIFPIIVGIIMCGKELIVVLLTPKWLPCLIYLEIGCIAYAFRPMQVINNSAIKASGSASLFLCLDLLKKGIGVVLFLLSMNKGVVAIAVSFAITNIISTIINMLPNKSIMDYGYLEQIKDILPSLLLSLAMGGCLFLVSQINLEPIVMLVVKVLVGVVCYGILSLIIKEESLFYLFRLTKKIFGK